MAQIGLTHLIIVNIKLTIKLTRCKLSTWISKIRNSSDFSLLNCNKIRALEILAFGMMISLT
jgi:hypothetical protein